VRPPVLLLAALVLAACGSDRRAPSAEPGASQSSRGPDAIVLRVPRAGGRIAAYVYPNLDSAVWRSSESAPALDRVLAFDGESGLLAAVDARGIPTRLDLRLGTVRRASDSALTALGSANGVDIFGVAAGGAVTRLTPSGGEWAVRFPAPIQTVEPQRDGTLLVAAQRSGAGVVWRLRPPGTRVADSVVVSGGGRVVSAQTGDRVYFAAGNELTGVQGGRTLAPLKPISLDAPVRAIVATPSGDRFYAALDGESTLSVVDRYSNAVASTVKLPGPPRDLRVDPLGRYVLARAARGDSAWVVTVGNDEVLGGVRTAWRADLPLVLPDGAIATAVGGDVVIVDGRSLAPRRTIAGAAADFWHLVVWNGFRPRAKGLDQPVEFKSSTTTDSAAADSTPPDSTVHPPDSTAVPPTRPDTTAPTRPAIPTAEAAVPSRRGYTVQFAAAGTEREARAVLRQLRLAGDVVPRIVPGTRNGKTLYRVVAGPFATRALADRVGRSSGRDYWLYEGAP